MERPSHQSEDDEQTEAKVPDTVGAEEPGAGEARPREPRAGREFGWWEPSGAFTAEELHNQCGIRRSHSGLAGCRMDWSRQACPLSHPEVCPVFPWLLGEQQDFSVT